MVLVRTGALTQTLKVVLRKSMTLRCTLLGLSERLGLVLVGGNILNNCDGVQFVLDL